jgi:hypothetical protein
MATPLYSLPRIIRIATNRGAPLLFCPVWPGLPLLTPRHGELGARELAASTRPEGRKKQLQATGTGSAVMLE